MSKITIKTVLGSILWESDKETLKEAVIEKNNRDANLRGAKLNDANLHGADLRDANLHGADLRDANLRDANLRGAKLNGANLYDANLRGAKLNGADLHGADLRGANLHGADLRVANLHGADLYGADLRGAKLNGANLHGANLYGADLRDENFKNLPTDFINQCSRDILFIFNCLRPEVPAFKEKLLAGEIDGSQYEGECACLVGTMANIKNNNVDQICESIPFYEKGTHNMGETWFLNIKKGDTPDNNQFAAHVLNLIEMVEQNKI